MRFLAWLFPVAFLGLTMLGIGKMEPLHSPCERELLEATRESGPVIMMRAFCPGPIPFLTQSQVGMRDPATGHMWTYPYKGLGNLWGDLPVRLTVLGVAALGVLFVLVMVLSARVAYVFTGVDVLAD